MLKIQTNTYVPVAVGLSVPDDEFITLTGDDVDAIRNNNIVKNRHDYQQICTCGCCVTVTAVTEG